MPSLTVGKFSVVWDRTNENMRVYEGSQMVLNTITNRQSPNLSKDDYSMLMSYFNDNRNQYIFS